MVMYRLSNKELSVVSKIVSNGFSRPEAMAMVILTTRQYSRPKEDLISTLQHYPNLEDRIICANAVQRIVNEKLLSVEIIDEQEILVVDAHIRNKIAQIIGDHDTAKLLLDLRKTNDHYVNLVGAMSDSISYTSYLNLLQSAQTQILMPHIMTDPKSLDAMSIIQERARSGVEVNVLGASLSLATKLRGASLKREIVKRIHDWIKFSKDTPNLNFRVTDDPEDLLFASSILVDSAVLRVVIHDPFNERSKEGILVEYNSDDARKLNVIMDFKERFTSAWSNAYSPTFLGVVLSFLNSFWKFVLGIILALAAAIVAAFKPDNVDDTFFITAQTFIVTVLGAFASSLILSGGLSVLDRVKKRNVYLRKKEND